MIHIKDNTATFSCGCKFEVTQTDPVRIKFSGDIENINLECPDTWELISSGNTKGIFQLESGFGQQYAKKLKPQNIEQLAALSAILRPGCLQAIRDGKSVTDHFILRKNGEEEIEYFHPDLKPILGTTFGEMIYQEQAMQIAQKFAGFDLQAADVLRKAIGKKKADIMAKVKKDFLDGCKSQNILTEEEAQELFGWIEKSQRYSFNKSHAVSYAMQSYVSAYCKSHFPVSFFTSWLKYAKDKQSTMDEIKLLVNNAKIMNIDIMPPDFRTRYTEFKRVSSEFTKSSDDFYYDNLKDKIFFGFGDIKGIGDSNIVKINELAYRVKVALEKELPDWTWLDILMFFSPDVGSSCFTALVEAGALDYTGVSRSRMLYEYEQYNNLTKKEQAWVIQNLYPAIADGKINNLNELMQAAIKPHVDGLPLKEGPCSNKKRVEKVIGIANMVAKPIQSLTDQADWIARIEESRLGISITTSIVDGCKNIDQANCSILEFIKHKEKNSGIFIGCQIDEFKTHITKKGEGDEMAFITVSDSDASIDAIAFPEVWAEIKRSSVCFNENTVMITGERSRDGESFILKKMWQLT